MESLFWFVVGFLTGMWVVAMFVAMKMKKGELIEKKVKK